MQAITSFLRLWLLDPLSAALLWLAGWWGRCVLLPTGTWLATRLTHLALRVAPEVVMAQTQDTSRTWAELFTSRTWWELRADGHWGTEIVETDADQPTQPLLRSVVPTPARVPAVGEVATLSAIAVALECDPDPILPDDRALSLTLANGIREVETHTPGWQDRLASDLTIAVLCLPRRIDERLQILLEEAQKLATESQSPQAHTTPPPADGVA